MKVFILSLVAILTTIFNDCESKCGCQYEYKRVGCFKDRNNNRALPEQVLNERDSTSYAANGYMIDWFNWDEYMPAMVCRCAEIALKKGYKYFGLQFWGECWSGPSPAADEEYNKHGRGSMCFGKGYRRCNIFQENCVGDNFHNFVYEVATYNCPVNFEKVGCQRDFHRQNWLALSARDRYSHVYMGKSIDWVNYDTFLPEFACECAKKVAAAGHYVFGLQYYGECWSGKRLENSYKTGMKSNNCINKCYQRCRRYDRICTGEGFANTVYRITHPQCEVKYENIGCYKSSGSKGKVFSKLLINDLYPPSNQFDGHMLTFGENWEKQIVDLVCRCARKAFDKGFKTFGIGNFGECWSGPQNYSKYGESNDCRKRKSEACEPAEPEKCAGNENSFNVFKIVAFKKPVGK